MPEKLNESHAAQGRGVQIKLFLCVKLTVTSVRERPRTNNSLVTTLSMQKKVMGVTFCDQSIIQLDCLHRS